MESRPIQSCETENQSFLQELGDQNNCSFFTGHPSTVHCPSFPDRVYQSNMSLFVDGTHSHTHDQQTFDQKTYCSTPSSYSYNQVGNWGSNQIRSHHPHYPCQDSPQRSGYFWPVCTSNVYPSQCITTSCDRLHHESNRQCMTAVSQPYSSGFTQCTTTGFPTDPVCTRSSMDSAVSNPSLADDSMFAPVQSTNARKPSFFDPKKHSDSCIPSGYSPQDEIKAIKDRLSVLHKAPLTSVAVQQEIRYLHERLKTLEVSLSTVCPNPAAVMERIHVDFSCPTDTVHMNTTSVRKSVLSHASYSDPYGPSEPQKSDPSEPVMPFHASSRCSQLEGTSHFYDVASHPSHESNTSITVPTTETIPGLEAHPTKGHGYVMQKNDKSTNQTYHSLSSLNAMNASLSVQSLEIPPLAAPSGHPKMTVDTFPIADSSPLQKLGSSNSALLDSLSNAYHLSDSSTVPNHISPTHTSGHSSVPSTLAHPSAPIPSGKSTLHYRQTANFVNTPIPSIPYIGPTSDVSSNPSNGQSGSYIAPSLGHAYSPYCRNLPGGTAPSYPYHVLQPNRHPGPATLPSRPPPLEYTDQHLQPIVPPSPTAYSQSSSLPLNSRLESDKCNGLPNSELMSYPLIMPKIPGSPPLSNDRTGKSPRRGQPMDREARNERRRQQRLRKKQEELNQSTGVVIELSSEPKGEFNLNTSETRSPSKRPRPKPRTSVQQSKTERECCVDTEVMKTLENSETGVDENLQSPKSKKRKSATRSIESKQAKGNKALDLDSNVSDVSGLPLAVEETCYVPPDGSSPGKLNVESADIQISDKQIKVIRTRPPRPKKRKPLPTLIRKKKRSAFYGNESDSEPDISGRLGGRSVESKIIAPADDDVNADRKRRSERTAGDRKRYTVDLDLNLSDDDSDAAGNDEISTLNSESATGMIEEQNAKIIEYVLGRRVTKRVIRKIISKDGDPEGPLTEHCSQSETATETVEEEEDVEEFYLKYKGYSYLHCEWRALDEIGDPRIRPKLRRFELKQANTLQTEDDDVVLFNPDYVEVERVLDMKVYRNGQLVSCDKSRQDVDPIALADLVELRKQRKRERERMRARALREAKARAKAEEAAVAHGSLAVPDVPETATISRNASDDTVEEMKGTTRESNTESPGEPLHEQKEGDQQHMYDRGVYSAVLEENASVDSITVNSSTTESKISPASPASDMVPTDSISMIPSSEDKIPPPIAISTKDSDGDSDRNSGSRSPVNVTYYLVKWRSLPYEDATWELAQDVDPAKVKEFLKLRIPPKVTPVARDSDYKIIRPDPSTWQPIETEGVYKNDNKLRDYQLEGVNWLTYCWFHHRNCILADEMGLGKTVQSVAFLLEIYKAGVQGPFLIIVPLSTVANWQRELENWSDLNVVVYHGSSTSRSMIQEYEIFYKRRPSDSAFRHDVYKFHVLVTTFEILMTDIEFFGQIHWAAAVIDEAHRLKNKKCKLGEGLRYLDLDHRVLLTGTPLQNNVEELFGLLNFLEPERFNCSSTFVAEYGDLKTEEQVESLKALLKPMMLRRLKEDVEKSLAPKEETIVEVELTNIQKKYYRAIMERNFTFLCKGSTYANAPNLMNIMMELRKCCNHPFLIKGAEEAILDEIRLQRDLDKPMSEEAETFQALVYASGKLVLIHKLLPKLQANGHKVLIFSQMIRVLDILEDYLIHQRFQFERIDGRIHGPLRQEAIDRFTVDPDKFVFLLCTKAGGLGINLTAADVVIIYDSDWNPQNDLQAQARCHRIGQQKMVKVYRLITRNTYEREMFDRASLKLGLDRAVLQSMGSKEARQAQMSKKEIEELLKKGAYGALMEDDKAGEDFCEEDIDKILQSRSRVVQLEQGEKNSTFSKATFSMSDNRSDIELDDPNFWQKWAKKAGVDESAGTMKDLIMKTPRQRRQTSRYSAISNEPSVSSPPTYDASDPEDSANGQTSGDENVDSTSGGRGRFRRCRRQRRHSRHPNMIQSVRRHSQISSSTEGQAVGLDSCRVEPLDRADLFRVERCLLTWPWGHWERGLAAIPFKRSLKPVELGYYASAVLAYALRFMPSSADTRIRTTIITLTRPHIWNLSLAEVAKAVAKATSRASRGCRNFEAVSLDVGQFSTLKHCTSSATDMVSESPSATDRCILTSSGKADGDISETSKMGIDETLDSLSQSMCIPTLPFQNIPDAQLKAEDIKDSLDTAMSLTSEETRDQTLTGMSSSPKPDTSNDCQVPMDLAETQSAASDKADEDEADHSVIDIQSKNVSPKTASFDPDILLPCDSFRKHMQRHSARLLNRVAFMLFLQCEVIGLDQSPEFISGTLSHEDFNELASSLPPIEAIDSELPVPWWDSCCDKCLLLGILKHGWEKYTLMRLDPCLCFFGRAMARLKESDNLKLESTIEVTSTTDLKVPVRLHSGLPNSESKSSDSENEDTPPATVVGNDQKPTDVEETEDVKSPAVFHVIDGKKEAPELQPSSPNTPLSENKVDESQPPLLEEEQFLDEASVDSVLCALPFPAVADLNSRARKIVGFFLRIKNQLEFDTYRQLPVDEEEEPPGFLSNTRFSENRVVKWTRREEADFYRVVSSFGVEFSAISLADTEINTAKITVPVKRRYRWSNFRHLANITRKSDESLTEYFHSFYRMCQRVCKRPLTEFFGPISTAATTTTSGSAPAGSEVPIEPISEERANRCLSRIDLLARIRNEILPHPHLVERLSLCQRGPEVPSWWLPGKHDEELLRAAAKHGLARTDLNILSDPEFSFHRIAGLIRDKLSRESAMTDSLMDFSGGQAARPDVSLLAQSVAKAALAQLEMEAAEEKESNFKGTNPVKSEMYSSSDPKVPCLNSETSDGLTTTDVVEESNECGLVSPVRTHSNDNDPDPDDIKTGHTSVDAAEATDSAGLSLIKTDLVSEDVSVKGEASEEVNRDNSSVSTKPNADGSKAGSLTDALPNEWSVKYAANLATAWPKDRTIQHRLELVCQAVDTNEWALPRRYSTTPTGAPIPIPDPSRALNESKIMSLASIYSANRYPMIAHSAYSIPMSLSGKLQSPYGMLHSANGSSKQPSTIPLPLNLESGKPLPAFAGPLLRNPSMVSDSVIPKPSDSSIIDSVPLSTPLPLNLVSSPRSSVASMFNEPTSETFAVSSPSSRSHVGPEMKRRTRVPYSSSHSTSSTFTSAAMTTPSPRGRGRGRGRGSRGGPGSRVMSARDRLNSVSSRMSSDRTATQNTSPTSHSGPDFLTQSATVSTDQNKRSSCRSSHDSDENTGSDRSSSRPMPPPISVPRGTPGTRGRKRRIESTRNLSEFASIGNKFSSHPKRERVELSHSEADLIGKNLKPRGSAAATSNSDVWEVRVPVISLVDGSLIYGEKAPKRRALEQWLESNPNYMPYSVEMEDRIIYSRVAGARGQDTDNMEALAYKHYLNSLIANATAGLHQSPASLSSVSAKTAVSHQQQQQQQQLLLLQQQQLLQAFGAYARHPAYAGLITSALGNWQAANSNTPSSIGVTESSGHSSIVEPNPAPPPTSSSSVSTRARSAASRSHTSPTSLQDQSSSMDSPAKPSTSQINQNSVSSEITTTSTSSSSAAAAPSDMESVLTAAYKQATANLPYMYNPLVAAAAYSQMMLSSATPTSIADALSSNMGGISNQQAALASLYANYVLSVKQTQQQQHMKQQLNAWDQQRLQQQQLASLATAIAAACANSGGMDATSLMSMFSGLATRPIPSGSSNGAANSENSQTVVNETVLNSGTDESSEPLPTPASPVNLADRSTHSPPDSTHDQGDTATEPQASDIAQSQTVLDLSK